MCMKTQHTTCNLLKKSPPFEFCGGYQGPAQALQMLHKLNMRYNGRRYFKWYYGYALLLPNAFSFYSSRCVLFMLHLCPLGLTVL